MSGKQGFPGPLTGFLISCTSLLAVFFWWVLGARFVDQVLCLALGMAGGRGLIAWLGSLQVAEPRRERLGLVAFKPALIPGLLLLTPAVFLVLELQNLLASLMGFEPLRGALEVTPVVLGLDQPGWAPAAVFSLVLVTPIASELLFRGLVQQGLVERLGERKGLLLASAYAAASHVAIVALGSVLGLAVFFAILPWQLMFGWLRLKTGSVWAGVLVRALSSALLLGVFAIAASRPLSGLTSGGLHLPPALLVSSAVSVVAGVMLVRRSSGAR